MGLLSDSLAALQGLLCKGRTQVCREGVGVGLPWVPVKVEKPQPAYILLKERLMLRDGEWGEGGIIQVGHLGTAPGQWAERLDGMLSKEVVVGRRTQCSFLQQEVAHL